MRVRSYSDPAEYQRCVTPMLLEREAENCITLGVLERAATAGLPADPADAPLLVVVEDAGRPIVAATMNRGFVLLVTRAPMSAVDPLVAFLHDHGAAPSGVHAPVGTADPFADAWARRTSQTARAVMGLGTYQLDAVVPPSPPVPGGCRPAAAADVELLDGWVDAFAADAGVERRGPADRRRHVEEMVRDGRLFVWCDPAGGPPVSMAAAVAPTPNGVRISLVYTPPGFRRRGYASAVVAAVSQRMLDRGRRFCFLNTDLANPTSNAIYRAIGYRHVCDFRKFLFEPRSSTAS